jgi:hypothetical protein
MPFIPLPGCPRFGSRDTIRSMPTLELSVHESEILTEVLESAVSDLGTEIADTDSRDYRNGLKIKKAIAMAILERVRNATG